MVHRRGRVRAALATTSLVAVALLAAACAAAPSASPTSSATVDPTQTATPATSQPATVTPASTTAPSQLAGAQPCLAADLKASHGLVEGAAGSMFTDVVLVSAVTCSVDAFPVLGLRDAGGRALVGGTATGGGRLDLVAGTSYTSAVRLANWCLPEPAFPLALAIRLGNEEVRVTGASFPDEEGGMPPCNGEGGPILEGRAWEAIP
jgi:hypothetical protein